MSSNSNTPPDDYFNDLSQSTGNPGSNNAQRGSADMAGATAEGHDEDPTIPKPKRIACIICRKRKLKCDGSKPSCSTCTRLGHSCAYDPIRRKSGPKRGYVKALEERLSKYLCIRVNNCLLPKLRWMLMCCAYRTSGDYAQNSRSTGQDYKHKQRQ